MEPTLSELAASLGVRLPTSDTIEGFAARHDQAREEYIEARALILAKFMRGWAFTDCITEATKEANAYFGEPLLPYVPLPAGNGMKGSCAICFFAVFPQSENEIGTIEGYDEIAKGIQTLLGRKAYNTDDAWDFHKLMEEARETNFSLTQTWISALVVIEGTILKVTPVENGCHVRIKAANVEWATRRQNPSWGFSEFVITTTANGTARWMSEVNGQAIEADPKGSVGRKVAVEVYQAVLPHKLRRPLSRSGITTGEHWRNGMRCQLSMPEFAEDTGMVFEGHGGIIRDSARHRDMQVESHRTGDPQALLREERAVTDAMFPPTPASKGFAESPYRVELDPITSEPTQMTVEEQIKALRSWMDELVTHRRFRGYEELSGQEAVQEYQTSRKWQLEGFEEFIGGGILRRAGSGIEDETNLSPGLCHICEREEDDETCEHRVFCTTCGLAQAWSHHESCDGKFAILPPDEAQARVEPAVLNSNAGGRANAPAHIRPYSDASFRMKTLAQNWCEHGRFKAIEQITLPDGKAISVTKPGAPFDQRLKPQEKRGAMFARKDDELIKELRKIVRSRTRGDGSKGTGEVFRKNYGQVVKDLVAETPLKKAKPEWGERSKEEIQEHLDRMPERLAAIDERLAQYER